MGEHPNHAAQPPALFARTVAGRETESVKEGGGEAISRPAIYHVVVQWLRRWRQSVGAASAHLSRRFQHTYAIVFRQNGALTSLCNTSALFQQQSTYFTQLYRRNAC